MLANVGESKFVDIDGVNTHYVVAGEGSPVLQIGRASGRERV